MYEKVAIVFYMKSQWLPTVSSNNKVSFSSSAEFSVFFFSQNFFLFVFDNSYISELKLPFRIDQELVVDKKNCIVIV